MESIKWNQPKSIVVNFNDVDEFKFLLGDEEIVFSQREMYILFKLLKAEEERFERNHIDV